VRPYEKGPALDPGPAVRYTWTRRASPYVVTVQRTAVPGEGDAGLKNAETTCGAIVVTGTVGMGVADALAVAVTVAVAVDAAVGIAVLARVGGDVATGRVAGCLVGVGSGEEAPAGPPQPASASRLRPRPNIEIARM
jgi:hypothetical protein